MSQIDELREILVGANAEQLAELKKRIEDIESRTRDVSEVLAPAIQKTDSNALVSSLQTPVSLSLKRAIRSEPQDYAEILYPVMAPSIRRAISQAISSLLVTINRTVESATSIKGIKTRVQSMRTGVPYAELALRQSLIYRVEHVYLIDRESGMQVAEVTSQETQSLDGDAVSAMFSAIQSFVQDSFSKDPSARLTDLKVGDHNVWVAHGPKLMLACVILGDAPEGLKNDLHDALYKIRTDYAIQIAEFEGDTEEFYGVEDIMMPLLQLQLREGEEQSNSDTPVKHNATVYAGLGLILLYLVYLWFSHNNKLSTVEYYLKKTPGIAATEVYWDDDKLTVEGLMDPEAKIPYGTFQAYGIEADTLEFKTTPFRSLELEMELQRFRDELVLPSGVLLTVRKGFIYLHGEAPIEWLESNNARIAQLAADRRLVISELSLASSSLEAVLNANFSEHELDTMHVSSVQEDGQIRRSLIRATLDANQMALMHALFAANPWVKLALESSETTQSSAIDDEPLSTQ